MQCKYWDSYKSKVRIKSMTAEISSEMDHEDKRDAINRAACEVQAFYDSHHNISGNMPVSKRDRESDDDDDDPSTAAAHSDSMRKASRTGCAETERDSE